MNTPIYDFVTAYAQKKNTRFHMPGHKGVPLLGAEPFDITEIEGADVLGKASGIIAESEENVTRLFDTGRTLYTTEGSTSAIKAMLFLAARHFRTDKRPTLLAARNAHCSFFHGTALLDLSVSFLVPENGKTVYSGVPTPSDVEAALAGASSRPFAFYMTSPNYLGEIADIAGIAHVCRQYDVPLLVDNAHGAYLAFLSPSQHPIRLGATMCADSAHKTLSVLTGGAYLHIAKQPALCADAKDALSLFVSTSPSYLTLASLDLCNRTLSCDYQERLARTIQKIADTKSLLAANGFEILPSEPLKIVIGKSNIPLLCKALHDEGIEYEFADKDYLVLMASAENKDEDFEHLVHCLIPFGNTKPSHTPPALPIPSTDTVLSPRAALMSESETVTVLAAVGRICADTVISCPPAVPIVICGERISEQMIPTLLYYGIDRIKVIK